MNDLETLKKIYSHASRDDLLRKIIQLKEEIRKLRSRTVDDLIQEKIDDAIDAIELRR